MNNPQNPRKAMKTNDFVLLGRGSQITQVPRAMWEKHVTQAQDPEHSQARLGFMTPAHHQVRYFVVRELAIRGSPISPEVISTALGLSLDQVQVILEELEKHLVFLVRNEQGAVAWAYPVTVEPTPHRLDFSTGERLYGA
jgi:hypothetical protein